MTDNRTYTATRYDADSDVDAHQMTHFDPYAELAARTQQLAEAMTLCAQFESRWADAQSALNLSEHLRQEQATELSEVRTLLAGWRQEAMESRRERLELNAEIDRLRAERDEAHRKADEAVSAIAVVQARLHGLGWYC